MVSRNSSNKGNKGNKDFYLMSNNFITFIGHSTLLISINGFKILTDPILTRWVYGVPRFKKAKFDVNDLFDTDLILISHNHSDHLNKKTLRRISRKISRKIPVATHIGNAKYVRECGLDNTIVLDYWQQKEFSKANVKITLVPASHSKTLPWKTKGASAGFIIESSRKNIYFAGDTAFSKDIFSQIAKKFRIDILLMPVGSYSPRWLLGSEHTSPQEAIEVLEIVGAEKMIPIHWGSFMLALDTPRKPIKVLKKETERAGVRDKIVILENGETFCF